MTWIFLSPAAVRITSNSVCSSSAAAAQSPPPAADSGHGDRRRRGDTEALLELLQQLAQLEDGERCDALEDLLLGDGPSHGVPFCVDLVGARSPGSRPGRPDAASGPPVRRPALLVPGALLGPEPRRLSSVGPRPGRCREPGWPRPRRWPPRGLGSRPLRSPRAGPRRRSALRTGSGSAGPPLVEQGRESVRPGCGAAPGAAQRAAAAVRPDRRPDGTAARRATAGRPDG